MLTPAPRLEARHSCRTWQMFPDLTGHETVNGGGANSSGHIHLEAIGNRFICEAEHLETKCFERHFFREFAIGMLFAREHAPVTNRVCRPYLLRIDRRV